MSNAPTETGFTAIAAGVLHAYALRADGSINAWGWNGYDQLSNTPSGTGFTALTGIDFGGLALRDGEPPSPPAVPEPSTLVLTALGAIAVVWRQSRRRTA
ncbi:MAG: PEP-CTERM sorting domain-containing protein [Planctomycetaceae bacterium]